MELSFQTKATTKHETLPSSTIENLVKSTTITHFVGWVRMLSISQKINKKAALDEKSPNSALMAFLCVAASLRNVFKGSISFSNFFKSSLSFAVFRSLASSSLCCSSSLTNRMYFSDEYWSLNMVRHAIT